jgi:hypothetical protein
MSRDIRNLRKEAKSLIKKMKKNGIEYDVPDISFMDVFELRELINELLLIIKGYTVYV